MSELQILRAQKQRLNSRLLSLQGTLKRTQNYINDILQEIDEITLKIEEVK
jgi:predicted  nucleic acid-binding Zn-ribbon protein